MLSKLVADREQSARTVVAGYSTHGAVAAKLVLESLANVVKPGEALPDLAFVLTLLARNLSASHSAMTEADQAHTRELGDDPAARDQRDLAKAAVLSIVTNIRLALTSRFGQDFGGRLGAAGAAPNAPADVLSWGRKIHDSLANLDLPAVDPEADDNDEIAAFSKDAALRKLGQRLDQLERGLEHVATETREAEATQAKKDKAVADYDRTFSLSAGLLEVLLRFAGETSLADKVRPSARRPGNTAAADAPDAGDTPDTPDSPNA